MPRRSRFCLAALLVTLGACQPVPPEPSAPPLLLPSAPVPVPVIALDLLEPAVQQQLAGRRAELDALLARPDATPAEQARLYGEVGQRYHAYGFHEAAAACYLNLLQLDGPSFRWQYYLAQVHLAMSESEQALPWLQQALEQEPASVPARVVLGRTLAELGQSEEAERILNAVLVEQPELALAHFTLGQLAAKRGDFAAAAERYRTVLRLQPEATSVHLFLADALRAAGDAEAARAQLALRGEGAIAFADPLMQELQQLTTGARRHLDEGVAAFQQGRFADAEAAFRRALQADRNNASAHLNLGSVLVQLGRPEEARQCYETTLHLDPQSSRAHFNLATLLAASGETTAAAEHFQQAIELYPSYRAAHFNLANLHLREGRFAAAAAGFAAVVVLDPASAEARQGEAVALMQDGRWRQAAEHLEEGLRALPGNRILTHTLARLLAASGDSGLRDGARALALMQGLMASESELQHVETLAMAYAETGDFAQAIRWQEAALEAVRRSSRRDLLVPLEANLARYRNNKPCRTPWHGSAFGGTWG